jgi:hypothetical protein
MINYLLGVKDKTTKSMDQINNDIDNYINAQNKAKKSGLFNGKHYLEYVEAVKQLKREKRNQEAIELLLKLIDAVEGETEAYKSNRIDWFTAHWYYEQLAIIYRKEKKYSDEVAILERHQQINNGAGSTKLAERLKKARELLHKNKSS